VIQIVLSTLVFVGCVAVISSSERAFDALWQTVLLWAGAIFVTLLSALHVVLSVASARWLVKNSRSNWSDLSDLFADVTGAKCRVRCGRRQAISLPAESTTPAVKPKGALRERREM
jgi:hypothetical protein